MKKLKSLLAMLLALAVVAPNFSTLAMATEKADGTPAGQPLDWSKSTSDEAEQKVSDQVEQNTPAGPGGVTQTLYVEGTEACEHHYVRQSDSYESTNDKAGYRHFKCESCDAEYAYTTDPLVYADGFQKYDGSIVEVNEGNLGAMNPYLPENVHSCDGEPHVNWSKEDGEWRVYIYASLDTNIHGYCSPQYVIYSAPVYDLADWRYESKTNGPIDPETQQPVSGPCAPDCVYSPYDDQYYFVKGTNPGEIWVSSDPGEGFDDVQVFNSTDAGANPENVSMFDPSVYITEDGTMYLLTASMNTGYFVSTLLPEDDYAKIDSTYVMKTAEPQEEFMIQAYEGPSLRHLKFGEEDVYVMIYASNYGKSANYEQMIDKNWESVLAYAWTTDLDEEAWNYGGIVYDTGGFFTKNSEGEIEQSTTPTFHYDNNHGGMAEINGQWYIFGHRNTYIWAGSRQGTAEKIDVQYAGGELTIDTVEMTSSGLADYLDAYQTLEAAIACYMTPAQFNGGWVHEDPDMYIDKSPWDHTDITQPWTADPDNPIQHAFSIVGIADEAVIGYKYLNFGETDQFVKLNMLVSHSGKDANGQVNVYLDAPNAAEGKLLTTITISDGVAAAAVKEYDRIIGTDGTEWIWLSGISNEEVSGTHAVYFVFDSDEEGTICKFDQFGFEAAETSEFRACPHTESYVLQDNSTKATDTEGGHRYYRCSVCGAEYDYETDPLVYADGFKKQDGTIVDVNEGNIGASNPFLPAYIHACDGEPHVMWSRADLEWRVYLYASLDVKETGYCGPHYVIYSAPVYDLSDWRFESQINAPYTNQGELSGGPVAPDGVYNEYNDCYYFAKGMPGEIWVSDKPGEGFDDKRVFRSTTPSGEYDAVANPDGYTNPENLLLFDPALFAKDDGTIIFFSSQWGAPNCYYVSTMSDDYSMISSTYKMLVENGTGIGSEENLLNYPYEGPSIRYFEDEGMYVMLYASQYTKEDGSPWESVLSYAYTKDIDNPVWTYGGIVYDTGGHFTKDADGNIVQSQTATFNYDNNHGGMAKINGQWYVFGHRNTFTSIGSRQDVAEKVNVELQGDKLVIDPVEMTSSGVADYLDAYQMLEAQLACYMTPAFDAGDRDTTVSMYINKSPWDADETAEHAFSIVGIADEAVIGYKYLNFGNASTNTELTILVSQDEDYVDGTMDVYLDAPSTEAGGTKIGSIQITSDAIAAAGVAATGTDGTKWSELTARMNQSVSGTHGVFFVFSSEEEGTICKLDAFEFARYTTGGGSSTGGSSTSGNQTETTTNPDGSTTTTVTKPDGSKTETTKAPNGSSSVVNTTKDGQVTANVTVSSAAANADDVVTLPMPAVSATDTKSNAPVITVDLPTGTTAKVEIPVANVTAGTVAILVHDNGTEEVIKTSFATEDGVVVELSDGATVKIVDNSKDFADVPASFWGADAVAFVTSHELFNGTSATTFSPNAEMTRAMIVTVLARLEGVDTSKGDTWYEAGRQWAMENGISDGTNMMDPLTREQLATMLYRYVGEPAVSGTITGFSDVADISDWAEDAMLWAVQNGIISGSGNNLNPQGDATRAQVATMLMRFIEKIA